MFKESRSQNLLPPSVVSNPGNPGESREIPGNPGLEKKSRTPPAKWRPCCGYSMFFLLALLRDCSAADQPFLLDSSNIGMRFDGHGGLSAGASSRLLFDYPENVRSDILDYLYKPNFGAALSTCKVEIGGDVQSTNGVEASHMHTSKDLNLERGYEWWLMAEAKRRNPDVTTYALSWGVPGWVGNGTYFSDDNVAYQTSFVAGARDKYNISIDYLGIWNERPWGNVDYVVKLRNALDAAGLNHTQIVGSDGAGQAVNTDHLKALATNRTFAEAETIQGGHYTHTGPPPAFWNEPLTKQTYWVNEDFSTLGGDWAAGGCWGRSLLQNFVNFNATSTISWATIWSVVDSWRYFGNGLMYAYEPWSGNYTVPPPIWTSAHVTQFAVPGWRYLAGSGTGLLSQGGSYTAMVPPPTTRRQGRKTKDSKSKERSARTVGEASVSNGDFTLVVEKLEGACLRRSVDKTSAEFLKFQLGGDLASSPPTHLKTWVTNSTVSFLQIEDTPVSKSGEFEFLMPEDTIITFTTTTGQARGHASTCTTQTPTMCFGAYQPHPFPYSENYDAGTPGMFARLHSDNGGAFEIRKDAAVNFSAGKTAGIEAGSHLLQASPRYPKGTEWAGNFDPITSIGATDWVNYRVNASVLLLARPPSYAVGDPMVPFPTAEGFLTDTSPDPITGGVYGGVCVRQIDQFSSGVCFLLGINLVGGANHSDGSANAGWVLQAGAMGMRRDPGVILASGRLSTLDLTVYHQLSLSVQGSAYTAAINGSVVSRSAQCEFDAGTAHVPPVGQAALRSSFSYVQFDDLSIDQPPDAPTTVSSDSLSKPLFVKHLLYPPKPAPGGPQAPAMALPGSENYVGCRFKMARDETAVSVARLAVASTGSAASKSHKIVIMEEDEDGKSLRTIGSAVVDLASANGGDLNGYAWADLASSVELSKGKSYVVASEEAVGGDSYYDGTVWVISGEGLLDGFSTPYSSNKSSLAWHQISSAVNRDTHKQCWDTRGGGKVDTWDCVSDGHNEGFNFSATDGLITVGPQSLDKSAVGKCFKGAKQTEVLSSERGEAYPMTSSVAVCDPSDPLQVYTYGEDRTLRLRSDANTCLTIVGDVSENRGIVLKACETSPGLDQQWWFDALPDPNDKPAEWSQCYGPVNIGLAK